MAESCLEKALHREKGSFVTATHSSVCPALTGGKQYQLTREPKPMYRGGQLVTGLILCCVKEEGIPMSMRELLDLVSSEQPTNKKNKLCNVLYPLIDDSGEEKEISYIIFS